MVVNNYGDHLAYTLEGQEVIFSIGNTVLEKSKQKELIPGTIVIMNGQRRLLYPTQNLQTLESMIEKMSSSETLYVLNNIMSLVQMLEDNDFLCKEAMDINMGRMYYDAVSGTIRCVVFPINREYIIQGETDWAMKFQQLALKLFNLSYDGQAKPYIDVLNDSTKSMTEKLQILREERKETQSAQLELQVPKVRKLVITSVDKRVYFEFVEGELILGSATSGINGMINISTSVSRRHCRVYKYGDKYAVQDLKSTNGTRINSYLLSPEQSYYLASGDRLQLADVELIVKIED